MKRMFLIEKSYPKRDYRPLAAGMDKFPIDPRSVRLDIHTPEKLPDEFFTELQTLLTKHTTQ